MSWVSRADVARALRQSREDVDDAVSLFGFERRAIAAHAGESSRASDADPRLVAAAGAPSATETLALPIWQVVRESRELDEAGSAERKKAPERPKLDPGDVNARLPTPSLVPWSALWPELFDLLAEHHPSSAVDAPKLLTIIGQGRPLIRVPRRTHRRWPQRLRVWVEREQSLIPIWDDQDEVVRRLTEACPNLERQVGRPAFEADAGDTLLVLGNPPQNLGSTPHCQGARLRALSPKPTTAGRGWRIATWGRRSSGDCVDLLLMLAAAAIWVRPGMLRALRLLLSDAGVDTELAVWQHPEVIAAEYDGLVIEPEYARALRAKFAELPDALQIGARDVIEAWHAELPEEVRLIEAAIWPGKCEAPFDVQRASDMVHALSNEVRAGVPNLHHFARYASGQLASALDHTPELEHSISILWAAGHPEPDAIVPRGINPAVASELTPGGDVHPWTICQRGPEWHAVPAGAPIEGLELASVETRLRTWWITLDGQRRKQPLNRSIDVGQARSVVIETERSVVELALQSPPSWAEAIGRDAQGLWAATTIAGRREVLHQQGGAWRQPDTGLGADGFGIYEDVRIGEVRIRFRLIRAGEFMRGSPETEAGRYDDEGPQHAVRLTEDFWLADTPTTQALWVEVMGSNPSDFKHPNRPVEQVSWDDVQVFLERVRSAGLDLRLPTEAQWEFACRASTTRATWVGDLQILGDRNAPVLDEIAWYGGNSGVDLDISGIDSSNWVERQYETPRAASRVVRAKAANPWGLYDMLGNVWEWCSDWKSPYSSDVLTDPAGPKRGSHRVFRGGAWRSHARRVRAACRGAGSPGSRYDYLGFRLSRGPAPSARSAELPRSGPAGRSGCPPGTGGSEGQVRSTGGGASPRRPQDSTKAAPKRGFFRRLFGEKGKE